MREGGVDHLGSDAPKRKAVALDDKMLRKWARCVVGGQTTRDRILSEHGEREIEAEPGGIGRAPAGKDHGARDDASEFVVVETRLASEALARGRREAEGRLLVRVVRTSEAVEPAQRP